MEARDVILRRIPIPAIIAAAWISCAFAASGPGRSVYGPQNPYAAIQSLRQYGITPQSVLDSAGRRTSKRYTPQIAAAAKAQEEAVRRMFAGRSFLLDALSRTGGKTVPQPASGAGSGSGASGWVYYFVSTSMPESLLRAYARDSVWTGGALVFRGLPPGRNLVWFLRHVAGPLLTDRKAVPAIVLDPRLFRAFGVDVVPTIVYSLVRPAALCAHAQTTGAALLRDPSAECEPAIPNRYWKVEGAVSGVWALRAFARAGAPGTGALLRLAALQGIPAGKRQAGIGAAAYAGLPGPGQILGLARTLRRPASGILWWQQARCSAHGFWRRTR